MAPRGWLKIAGWSLVALVGEVFGSFGFAFNPGWANAWPFGLSIYTVWSTGMSSVFFGILVTVAVGTGAVTGAVCSYFGVGLRHGRAVFAGWVACSSILALVASIWTFRAIYASTLEMWPTGYNPR